MAEVDAIHDSEVYFDPTGTLAESGGFVHSNNIHWYFRNSPFFDRTSVNNELIVQNQYEPDGGRILGSREAFEKELSRILGRQYVVAVDPMRADQLVRLDAPQGPVAWNNVWIMRYQERTGKGPSDYIPLDYFYIMQQGQVFRAPRLDRILGNRLLDAAIALDKVFVKATELPVFSATHGHSYLVPEQSKQHISGGDSTTKATTPGPEGDVISSKDSSIARTDVRSLRAALNMAVNMGGKYADDEPLIGEPGNWRFGNAEKSAVTSLTNKTKAASSTGDSRAASPTFSIK